MARATLSTIDKALKEVYGDVILDLLNNENRAYRFFLDASGGTWTGEGRVYVIPTRIGRNRGIKATAEGGYLPNADTQKWDDFRIVTKYMHGTFGLTAQALKHATGNNRAAFMSTMEAESRGLVEDFGRVLNRIVWSDGRGILARVDGDIGGGGTTTLPVKDPGGILGTVNGARFLPPGLLEVAIHPASPANNTPNVIRGISARAADGSSVTLDASVTNVNAPDGAILTLGVTRNSVNEGSWNLEPMGLPGIIDNGTYASVINGVTRSTQPLVNANVFNNVGQLDEILLERGFDMADELCGYVPTDLIGSYGVHRELQKLTMEDRRYTNEQVFRPDPGIKGGGKKRELQYGGRTLMKERDAPYGHLYFVDRASLHKLPMTGDGSPGGGEWINEDGAVLRKVEGKDEFEATYRLFNNFFATRFQSHTVFNGINATNDINNTL